MTQEELAHSFHQSLIHRDWAGLRKLFHDDATWTLPGNNKISGTANGGDAVVERAKLIAAYGLSFELLHVLLSASNMALSLRNRADHNGLHLDEFLATVCRLRDGKIIEIETYLSDVQNMDRFFANDP